jgi:hypothetical protein
MSEGEIDYKGILDKALARFNALTMQQAGIEAELARLRQFIQNTALLLPDYERDKFIVEAAEVFEQPVSSNQSLTDAIRVVLGLNYPAYLTVAKVRDDLIRDGFDFSAYTSNALASVSTTLRRLKEAGEVDSGTSDGVTTYRWKRQPGSLPDIAAKMRNRQQDMAFDERMKAGQRALERGRKAVLRNEEK